MRISEKQFATRANPANQWSINDRLSFYVPPVEDNYTRGNWLVDSDAFLKATAVHDQQHSLCFHRSCAKKAPFDL